MTSNILPHLAPVDALAGGDGLLGGGDALRDRRSIQKLNVVRDRLQALRWQPINGLLDVPTKLNGADGKTSADILLRVRSREHRRRRGHRGNHAAMRIVAGLEKPPVSPRGETQRAK